MKPFIKVFALVAMFILGGSLDISAQTKKSNKTTKKVVVKKSTAKSKVNHVSRSNVTYKKSSKKIKSVRNLPTKTVIKYKGSNYYYANQKYYTYSGGRYISIAPKIGFKVTVLPSNYNRIAYNNRVFYNADGIFYEQINNSYEVVDPEIGTVVTELPAEYEKVTIDGFTYYEYANILYEKIQVNGTRAYEVVGIVDMD